MDELTASLLIILAFIASILREAACMLLAIAIYIGLRYLAVRYFGFEWLN